MELVYHDGGLLMPEKICRIAVVDGCMVREDGHPLIAPIYVYPDADGVAWLWTGPQADTQPVDL